MRPTSTTRPPRNDQHYHATLDTRPPSPSHAKRPARTRPQARSAATARKAIRETSRRSRPQVLAASVGDHVAIQQLLIQTLPRWTAAEFQQQLDDPSYRPEQRLIVRQGTRTVGHLRCLPRDVRFGAATLRLAVLTDLATADEPCAGEWRHALLKAAQQRARQLGAPVLLARTADWRWFLEQGWTVGPRHTFSEIGPRQFLSQHAADNEPTDSLLPLALGRTPAPHYTVQLWRRVEQECLQHLFVAASSRAHGATVRGDSDWQALIERGRYERIYVVRASAACTGEDVSGPIVGYAVVSGQRVSELVVAEGHADARVALLRHVCHDAIERDLHPVRVDAPPADPIHTVLRSAGGHVFHYDLDQGHAILVRIVDERTFIAALHREWVSRCTAAGLSLPVHLPLVVDQQRYRLTLSRRAAQWSANPEIRGGLHLSRTDLWQLLLGRTSAAELLDMGRAHTVSRRVAELAESLLARVPLWLPAWEQ